MGHSNIRGLAKVHIFLMHIRNQPWPRGHSNFYQAFKDSASLIIEECFSKLSQSTSTHFEIITFCVFIVIYEKYLYYVISRRRKEGRVEKRNLLVLNLRCSLSVRWNPGCRSRTRCSLSVRWNPGCRLSWTICSLTMLTVKWNPCCRSSVRR